MFYLKVLLLLLSLSGNLYYLFSLYAVIDFFKEQKIVDKNYTPPITILKPLCGIDWETEANLTSFCEQDYPEYQIIFACQKSDDPVIPIVQKIIAKYPKKNLLLVINDRNIGANLKVSNLANAVEKAKHEILIIADSDIRVTPNYLIEVIQPLKDDKVGVVTCLYKSSIHHFLGIFEGIDIATHFTPRILTAKKLAPVNFAFGSTTVIRKKVLDEIGGFPAIADYLADDYQLGYQPTQKGYQVVLSTYIVEHLVGKIKLRELLKRQNRWFMCIRVSRFWGYLGLIFTQGTVFSLLFYLVTLSKIGLLLLVITWLIRILTAYIIANQYLKDNQSNQYILLINMWDLISFIIWIYSLFGNKIEWRGKKIKLIKGGKLINN